MHIRYEYLQIAAPPSPRLPYQVPDPIAIKVMSHASPKSLLLKEIKFSPQSSAPIRFRVPGHINLLSWPVCKNESRHDIYDVGPTSKRKKLAARKYIIITKPMSFDKESSSGG